MTPIRGIKQITIFFLGSYMQSKRSNNEGHKEVRCTHSIEEVG